MMMDQMRDGLGRTPVECTANERNGETPKNGEGVGKEGYLGFWDVDAGRNGHADKSIWDGWKRGTDGCRGDDDLRQPRGMRNVADG